MFFHIPLIMYNLWRIARFTDERAKWRGWAGGKRFTMNLFMRCVGDITGSFVNDRDKRRPAQAVSKGYIWEVLK